MLVKNPKKRLMIDYEMPNHPYFAGVYVYFTALATIKSLTASRYLATGLSWKRARSQRLGFLSTISAMYTNQQVPSSSLAHLTPKRIPILHSHTSRRRLRDVSYTRNAATSIRNQNTSPRASRHLRHLRHLTHRPSKKTNLRHSPSLRTPSMTTVSLATKTVLRTRTLLSWTAPLSNGIHLSSRRPGRPLSVRKYRYTPLPLPLYHLLSLKKTL